MDDNTRTGAPSLSPDELKKRLKKQAKREARAMQDLDQARRDVEKAERKLAQAQQNLQKRRAQVQACTAKLEKIRSSSPSSAPASQDATASSEAGPASEAEGTASGEAAQFMLANEEAPADQPLFDANETVDLAEVDEPGPAAEGPADEESTALDEGSQERSADQADQGLAPVEVHEEAGTAPAPPRKPAVRRTRTSTTTRQRGASGRTKSNGTE